MAKSKKNGWGAKWSNRLSPLDESLDMPLNDIIGSFMSRPCHPRNTYWNLDYWLKSNL